MVRNVYSRLRGTAGQIRTWIWGLVQYKCLNPLLSKPLEHFPVVLIFCLVLFNRNYAVLQDHGPDRPSRRHGARLTQQESLFER